MLQVAEAEEVAVIPEMRVMLVTLVTPQAVRVTPVVRVERATPVTLVLLAA